MKKFRRISALMLALALVCTLAISAFAAVSENNIDCGSVTYSTVLDGTIDSATATVTINTPDYLNNTKYFTGSIELHYVYCDETMVRPSNYTYASVTQNFTKFNISVKGSCTVECSSGNVMIEASADYQMVEQTTSTTTTTTNTTLSL